MKSLIKKVSTMTLFVFVMSVCELTYAQDITVIFPHEYYVLWGAKHEGHGRYHKAFAVPVKVLSKQERKVLDAMKTNEKQIINKYTIEDGDNYKYWVQLFGNTLDNSVKHLHKGHFKDKSTWTFTTDGANQWNTLT